MENVVCCLNAGRKNLAFPLRWYFHFDFQADRYVHASLGDIIALRCFSVFVITYQAKNRRRHQALTITFLT